MRAPRGLIEDEAPQRPSRKTARLPARGTVGDGPECPEDREHGRLLWMPGSGRYYCSHSGHMGRLATHPDGPTPPTKCFFTKSEVNEH